MLPRKCNTVSDFFSHNGKHLIIKCNFVCSEKTERVKHLEKVLGYHKINASGELNIIVSFLPFQCLNTAIIFFAPATVINLGKNY